MEEEDVGSPIDRGIEGSSWGINPPDPKPIKKEKDPDAYQERLKEDEVKRLEQADII